MKVLLTGSAGFIGTAVGELLEADGHEVVRVDLMLPDAHGSATPPSGTRILPASQACKHACLPRRAASFLPRSMAHFWSK